MSLFDFSLIPRLLRILLPAIIRTESSQTWIMMHAACVTRPVCELKLSGEERFRRLRTNPNVSMENLYDAMQSRKLQGGRGNIL